jgi:hypothetical protein
MLHGCAVRLYLLQLSAPFSTFADPSARPAKRTTKVESAPKAEGGVRRNTFSDDNADGTPAPASAILHGMTGKLKIRGAAQQRCGSMEAR